MQFPQEVIDHFIAVRTRLQPELVKLLEQRAQKERDRSGDHQGLGLGVLAAAGDRQAGR